MAITVHYMGILAEAAGISVENLETTGSRIQLLGSIMEKHPELGKLNFVVSHNGHISHGEIVVKNGDQITLIPPAPGG